MSRTVELIPYTPEEWNVDQAIMHTAATMEEAFHNAACLSGGWYRRAMTIDVQIIDGPEPYEIYRIRPSEVPQGDWTPCYIVARVQE